MFGTPPELEIAGMYCRTTIIKKYTLANFLNCWIRFFGRNVTTLYLLVLMMFFINVLGLDIGIVNSLLVKIKDVELLALASSPEIKASFIFVNNDHTLKSTTYTLTSIMLSKSIRSTH